ncbi:MAG: type VI secretion system baseplate subunit TssE [Gemmatimonadota bacterium]
MAGPGAERTVRQSVLDRLLDDAPRVPADPPTTLAESARAFRAAVLRDVEWLLNTRRIAVSAPDACPEVQRSVYHFGVPDVTSQSGDSEPSRQRLLRQVEECIATFEPRISNVRVTPAVVRDAEGGRRLRFLVEGTLRMDPGPERVAFDTELETSSGKFRVTGDGNA